MKPTQTILSLNKIINFDRISVILCLKIKTAKLRKSKRYKNMVYLCRKEHFCASHRLFNPAWSDEKNEEEFGICSNQYFHGHNFELIVKVKGKINPNTGCVLDLKKLGKLIRTEIIDKVDHKNLNIQVDFLEGKIPSCEIIIMEFWKILAPKILDLSEKNAVLHSLTLFETEKNYVEYFGEE